MESKIIYTVDGAPAWRVTPLEMQAFARIAAAATVALGRVVPWAACVWAFLDARDAGEIQFIPLHRDITDEPIVGIVARRLDADPNRYANIIASGSDPVAARMIGEAAMAAAVNEGRCANG